MTTLRSLIFLVAFWVSVIGFGGACAIIGLFSYRGAYAITRVWTKITLWLLAHICGLRYQVHGKENLPSTPAVVLMNHQSAWETIAQIAIFPQQCWVLKKELLRLPFFGWSLRVLRPIAIDRAKKLNAWKHLVEQGRERIQQGLWIMIFPEGTRVPLNETRPFARGGANLAKELGLPVIPVAHNAGRFWRHKSFLRLPGFIDVYIGKPIDTSTASAETITEQTQQWVASHTDL